jgi:hypothetical protein
MRYVRSLSLFALAALLALAAAPAHAQSFVTATDDPWNEPDIPEWAGDSDRYADVLERTLRTSGAPAGSFVTGIEVRVDLHHTYVADLEIRLETGLYLTYLWNRQSPGDGDGIHRTFTVTAFNGQSPNQTWYLYIKDRAAGDTGELESWSVKVYYAQSTCASLGYPLGACGSASTDGDCSADAWEVRECVRVGDLNCWELREDCWPDGVCTDPLFGPARCIYDGDADFCSALAAVGSGCAHGESDCDSNAQCLPGLSCMGPIGGSVDGCCYPGEAWDGSRCVPTDCAALGYPLGSCGAVDTDGDCTTDFGAVKECRNVGPATCWVQRQSCPGTSVCFDSMWSAATCIDNGHADYCAALARAGSGCLWGESDCDGDGECLGDLRCKGPIGGTQDGCCAADEDWNGAACVPTDCLTLGYPRGGCGTVGATRCSAEGGELWQCVTAGTVKCWDLRQTCAAGGVCWDSVWAAPECIVDGHPDFCAALVAVGRRCARGQEDCDFDSECAAGLDCQGPVWPWPGQDGCCLPSEVWDGVQCGLNCEQECVAGTSGCLNPTRRWTCGEANDQDACLERIAQNCGTNEVCRDGRCVPGTNCTTAADCPTSEYCASYGRCAPDVCPAAEAFCRGPRPMQCNEDGSGASLLPSCGDGGVCVDGACACYSDAGCAASQHCAQVAGAPFFADFAGGAGEPAWTVGTGSFQGAGGVLWCELVAQAVDHVAEEQGAASITVPADHDPPRCGQMISVRADLGPGMWRARLRAPSDAHTIAELAADAGPGAILVRLLSGGQAAELAVVAPDGREARERVTLGFDASAAHHVYGFDWHPDRVVLVVDEVERATISPTAGHPTAVIPTQYGPAVLTHWTAPPPHDLAGPPHVSTTFVVDWVSWSPFGAACQPDVCPAGLLYCDGLQRRQCDARGTGSTLLETCPANCSGGACIAACATAAQCAGAEYCTADGRCVADVCPQGTVYCEASERRQCRSDGSGSDLVETCPYGCREGACLPPGGCLRDADCDREQFCATNGVCNQDRCTQGRTFCQELERRLCNANGSDSSLIEACALACVNGQCTSECVDDTGCAAGQFCEGVRCVPDVCAQGQIYCDGDERRRCNGNGSGSTLVEVCPDGACVNGQCQGGPCEPACRGRECGDDGCGGSCGACGQGYLCDEGRCQPEPTTCTPYCGIRECGDDGCGGSCGTCPVGETCTAAGSCEGGCVPDCAGRACGDDGCGGSCGACPFGTVCSTVEGQCVLDPNGRTDTGGGLPLGDTAGGGGTDIQLPPAVGDSSGGCAAAGGGSAGPGPFVLLTLLAGAVAARRRRRARG